MILQMEIIPRIRMEIRMKVKNTMFTSLAVPVPAYKGWIKRTIIKTTIPLFIFQRY